VRYERNARRIGLLNLKRDVIEDGAREIASLERLDLGKHSTFQVGSVRGSLR
jgi:hypothetical protein